MSMPTTWRVLNLLKKLPNQHCTASRVLKLKYMSDNIGRECGLIKIYSKCSSSMPQPYKKQTLAYNKVTINFNNCLLRHLKDSCPPLLTTYRSFGKSVGSPDDGSENKPSLYQRFKKMAKEYWYVLIPVHVVTSAFWFGGFYYLAITGVDIVKLMELIGTPESWVSVMRGSKAGGIVTAYTLYKVATPARYTVTLGGTTLSINYLTKWGWIKPMPSQAELRDMYENKKTAYKDLKRSYSEKMTAASEEIKEEFKKTREDIAQQMTQAKSGMSKGFKDDMHEFKQGINEAADEWRHVGKLVKQRTKEIFEEEKITKAVLKEDACIKKEKLDELKQGKRK